MKRTDKSDTIDTDNAPAVQALARQRAKVKPNTPAQVACFDEAEAEARKLAASACAAHDAATIAAASHASDVQKHAAAKSAVDAAGPDVGDEELDLLIRAELVARHRVAYSQPRAREAEARRTAAESRTMARHRLFADTKIAEDQTQSIALMLRTHRARHMLEDTVPGQARTTDPAVAMWWPNFEAIALEGLRAFRERHTEKSGRVNCDCPEDEELLELFAQRRKLFNARTANARASALNYAAQAAALEGVNA